MHNIFGHWNMPESLPEQIAAADVVIAHEFGNQKDISATTRSIMEVALDICQMYMKPLICQFPGNQVALERGYIPLYVVRENLKEPGEYLDTDEVNRQAVEICHRFGWKTALVVTHRHHLWRAAKSLEHHGITAVIPNTETIGYDPHCSRLAVRFPLVFGFRELGARTKYELKGLI